MGGGEQFQQLVLAILGGSGQFAGRLDGVGISLWFVPSLELPVVEFAIGCGLGDGLLVLLLKEPEKRSLFRRIVQSLGLGLLVDMHWFDEFLLQMELASKVASAGSLPFQEEIPRQFILIDLDEIAPRFRLAETMVAIDTMMRPASALLIFQELPPRVTFFPGNKLIRIHLFFNYYPLHHIPSRYPLLYGPF